MDLDVAIPIELDVWQITSEYAIIRQYDDRVNVRFRFWDDKQKEVSGKTASITFNGVWLMRYSRFNKTRYYPNEIEHAFYSYFLQVPNSSWIQEESAKRSQYEKDWEKYDKREYKHYVFQNNSYYVELIASDVVFEVIDRTAEDEWYWNHY